MHRLGDGTRIEDLDASRAEWRAAGRSPCTYPNKGEFDAYQEDPGELSFTYRNGSELRRHATVKTHARGGSRKIAHNVTIVRTPDGRCTYYPDRDHDEMLANARAAEPEASQDLSNAWRAFHNKADSVSA